MQHLRGQTALITGAARRIGKALALALAKTGAQPVIHYHRSASEAEEVAETIRNSGIRVWTLQADLEDLAQAEALLPTARELAGPLSILINCASIFPEDRVTDFSEQDFFRNMTTNALAPLWLSRAFARQTRQGVILNVLDTRILDYDQKHAAYHLSKRTLYSLTRMLSMELAPDIRVNAIAPGLILPPPGKDDSYLQQMRQTNPLQAIGKVEDICEAALFLARSTFITGQVIYVDGGRHLKGTFYGT